MGGRVVSEVKMVILSTDDLDESIRFYTDTAHERRAVVYDNTGNGLVFYKPLAR